MRPKGSPKELETRRIRGVALLRKGRSLAEVARIIGCYPSAIMRWRNAAKGRGTAGLRARPTPGRPLKLNMRQRQQLLKILLRGALARGYSTDVWTTKRIAEVIEAEFEVRYHRDHVGRLMHVLNWSCQKPDRRALERREDRIRDWKDKEWPRIKKGLPTWAPTSCLSTNPASC
jgi:transposase